MTKLWRESAIETVLEYEFCDLWGSLSGNMEWESRREERERNARLLARRIELERLSDDLLFGEARDAASSRGYDRGVYAESEANSMMGTY